MYIYILVSVCILIYLDEALGKKGKKRQGVFSNKPEKKEEGWWRDDSSVRAKGRGSRTVQHEGIF